MHTKAFLESWFHDLLDALQVPASPHSLQIPLLCMAALPRLEEFCLPGWQSCRLSSLSFVHLFQFRTLSVNLQGYLAYVGGNRGEGGRRWRLSSETLPQPSRLPIPASWPRASKSQDVGHESASGGESRVRHASLYPRHGNAVHSIVSSGLASCTGCGECIKFC